MVNSPEARLGLPAEADTLGMSTALHSSVVVASMQFCQGLVCVS